MARIGRHSRWWRRRWRLRNRSIRRRAVGHLSYFGVVSRAESSSVRFGWRTWEAIELYVRRHRRQTPTPPSSRDEALWCLNLGQPSLVRVYHHSGAVFRLFRALLSIFRALFSSLEPRREPSTDADCQFALRYPVKVRFSALGAFGAFGASVLQCYVRSLCLGMSWSPLPRVTDCFLLRSDSLLTLT